MAKKKKENEKKNFNDPNVIGLRARVLEQPITETLELNYMPYAMSVIVSRAIPEIDGFKPSHRKLLYTMYKMGLLNGARTKSANIVGQTMKLNPHGDAAIYDTMVRLSAGHEALLAPFVDSKGNFGKVYSRDMSYAASRYTEAKLSKICAEIFADIDKNTVDMVDNYDGSLKEPRLLPTSFPNILVSANSGIAVGMASMICGFNLGEVCRTAINYIKDPDCDLFETLPAPDFPTGGEIIYDRAKLETIYKTGRGSFDVRARWRFVPGENIIEIYEIPYTTTTDIIIDRIVELSKAGKLKEVSDIRDETDLGGLRIAIDLKRGTDPEKLMAKLFKSTTLQDPFPCNFNVLVNDYPRVLGVREILREWTAWRTESIKRRISYDLQKKQEKLHLLQGLGKILLDIDKAIAIIRSTERESDVVPNLMVGFGIDELQANFVAEIKLRNINREYIMNRVSEINQLLKDVEELEQTLSSSRKIKALIIADLKRVCEKYETPRRSGMVYPSEAETVEAEEEIEDYHATLFISKEGYFKKLNDQSLRMAGEQKFKEGDSLSASFESRNRAELLVFTDSCQVYKTRVSDFEDMKASSLGVYLPTALKMDQGERVLFVIDPGDYGKQLLFLFENGNGAKVKLASFQTKTNRKKLTGAYSDKSPLIAAILLEEEKDIALSSSDGRVLVFNSSLMQTKETRNAAGVKCMSLKKQKTLIGAVPLGEMELKNVSRYRARSLPAAGALLRPEDAGMEQLSLL